MYKLKELFPKILAVILIIACGVGGTLLTWNSLHPLNEDQLVSCEQIAQNVYAQGLNSTYDDSGEFAVKVEENTISVKLSDSTYYGGVIAQVQDGTLAITRSEEIVSAVLFCIFRGLCLASLAVMFIVFNYNILYLNGY